MLEPLEAHMKHNKRGLGAERVKKKIPKTSNAGASNGKDGNVSFTGLAATLSYSGWFPFFFPLNHIFHYVKESDFLNGFVETQFCEYCQVIQVSFLLLILGKITIEKL